MDPEYVDEEEEAAAMAAMMGFSGFGSQKPPAKRRKFTTDAFIDGQEPVDRGGKKGQGSGGNTMPLGKTRVFGTGSTEKAMEPAGMNDSEIDLGDDDEADGPQYVDTSLPPPVLQMHSEGPQYIDTSEPPPGAALEEEAREMQSRIDAILASTDSKEPAISLAPGTHQTHSIPQRSIFNPPPMLSDSDFMRGGPRPGQDTSRDAFSDSASIASSRPSHRGGLRNENWYLDYYDPSFNENPWARLEKEKGLEPFGKWPEIQRGGTNT